MDSIISPPNPSPWLQPLTPRRHIRIYYGNYNAKEEEGSGVRPGGVHSDPAEYGVLRQAARPFGGIEVCFFCVRWSNKACICVIGVFFFCGERGFIEQLH